MVGPLSLPHFGPRVCASQDHPGLARPEFYPCLRAPGGGRAAVCPSVRRSEWSLTPPLPPAALRLGTRRIPGILNTQVAGWCSTSPLTPGPTQPSHFGLSTASQLSKRGRSLPSMGARLASSVKRETLNLRVLGLSPTLGVLLTEPLSNSWHSV